MNICILIGTRPEIIKMSPLVRACETRRIRNFILHTGQHYSYEMDRKFFEDLGLPAAKYNLNVGGQEYRKQVGLMIREITKVLTKEQPDIVFVQGDTNSVLAGALAANKLGISIGHHEAGLRSHDLGMLEETNRIITDHIADYLFVPTEDAMKNLREEGIDHRNVFLTGNTVVDAVKQNLKIAKEKVHPLERLGLSRHKYILATAHRAENVDHAERLQGIMRGLGNLADHFGHQVVFPIHPRTSASLVRFAIEVPKQVRLVDPVGYLEFLQLEDNALLMVTDSGGLQEEACILKVPCVTIRDNTERPETVAAGINVLAGTNPDKILSAAIDLLGSTRTWINPFGDGHAAEKIIECYLKCKV
jgi:UDP-N-acetylglucosamine 2-epimerase (non-hydrolysing)